MIMKLKKINKKRLYTLYNYIKYNIIVLDQLKIYLYILSYLLINN